MEKKKQADSYTRLYNIWRCMKQRCNNPNHSEYHRYGGRGIRVYPYWENSFESFKKWALANGYQDDLTIDRINNDAGYNPRNCQWISRSENSKKNTGPRKLVPQKARKAKRLTPEMKHYNAMMRIYNDLINEGIDPETLKKPEPPSRQYF